MKFFKETAKLKELLILQHIEMKPATSQHEIAGIIEATPSMVNGYIARLEEKGYLRREYQSSKVVFYQITPEGIERKKDLSFTYFHELLSLYHLAERHIAYFLEKLEEKGYKSILFYGAGETAKTILTLINERQRPLKVLAVIDDGKAGQEILGYPIIPREHINLYAHDAIVITSPAFADQICEKLEEINYPMDSVERFFTAFIKIGKKDIEK